MSDERWMKYNASAPVGELKRETLSIFHPELSQDWHFTIWPEEFSANVRGVEVDFLCHPFTASLPESGTSGRHEIEVTLFNTGREFVREIKRIKADVTTPIDIEYNQFFEPETDGIDKARRVMAGTSVPFDTSNVTIVGTWLNFLNRRFLKDIYSTTLFPGLDR